MKNHTSQILDLAITQAIEHYRDMEPEEAYNAIIADWPEQIAVLLIEFLFRTWCGACGELVDFIQIERDNDNTTFISAFCDCEIHYPHRGQL